MSDKFTARVKQCYGPDGRTVWHDVLFPTEYKDLYEEMVEAGCRFEAEVLRTNETSLTVFNTVKDQDIDCRIIKFGADAEGPLCEMLKAKNWQYGN